MLPNTHPFKLAHLSCIIEVERKDHIVLLHAYNVLYREPIFGHRL